ncbi:MAG TPA: right-handed parallel beta-helix repeat-containing protein, partial [Chitinophagaceae bacterium]|nr:right-handed parallel beta-helix repeat-containing protein [Chitinophagaceae bacterium]
MKNRLLLLTLFFIKLVVLPQQANATNYYFSTTDGDDSRTSAQAQNQATPWKSIDKLNSFFSSLQGGDQILFKRGDTFYGSITISKSGPITLGAYGSGAKPVITGFSSISSWTSVGNGLYEAVVPAGLSTLNVVTLDGVFQVMGKMPKGNTGYYTASAGGTSSVSSSGISGIPNFTGGEIVWRPYHWTLWRGTVTSQTSSSVNFTAFPSTSGGGTEAAQANYGFFFQNSPAACTALGEWAYNASSHKITMFFGGSGPGSHVVKVSSLQNIITNGGFSSITFDNLNIQGGNTYLISLSGSSNNTVNACDLFGGGVYGIFANGNSPNFAFTNSTMDRVNSNGIIYSSGSTASTITGNTFSNIGAVAGMGGSGEGQYFGIIDVKNGSNVSLNKLTNTGYIPICFQGTNNTIQNNYIDTFCTVKDDGAGIYCGGQSDAGTKVVSNIVFNSIGAPNGTPDKDSRAHGIYVDDGGSNVEIANNTVAYSSGAGIYDHNGHELNIHGNTSFDNRTTGIKYYNDGNSIANITITNNIFFAKTASEYVLQSSGGSASPVGFFTSADNNFWCRPMNENSAFSTLVPSGSYNLASWKSFTGKEASSKATPMTVTDASKIRFEYNAGSSSKVVNLGATYMDVKGTTYAGSITLAGFSSAVLLYVSGTVTNQNPVAKAGPDQSFFFPTNSTTLNGSGTDADGTIASYQWSKISGPTQFTIVSATQASTAINNLAVGVYQFQLQVTDNAGATGKDTLTITVSTSANQAPVAKAGSTQIIILPISTTILDG